MPTIEEARWIVSAGECDVNSLNSQVTAWRNDSYGFVSGFLKSVRHVSHGKTTFGIVTLPDLEYEVEYDHASPLVLDKDKLRLFVGDDIVSVTHISPDGSMFYTIAGAIPVKDAVIYDRQKVHDALVQTNDK